MTPATFHASTQMARTRLERGASAGLQTIAVNGNQTTASYTMAAAASSVGIVSGGSGGTTLTLTSTNFSGTVSFLATATLVSGSGSASAVTATATPVTLTAGGTGTSTITIATATGAADHAPKLPWKSGSIAICAVLLGGPFTFRRKRAIAVLLMALITMTAFLLDCGSSFSGTRTYSVMLTPTATSNQAGAMVTNPAPMNIIVSVQ